MSTKGADPTAVSIDQAIEEQGLLEVEGLFCHETQIHSESGALIERLHKPAYLLGNNGAVINGQLVLGDKGLSQFKAYAQHCIYD